MGRSRYIITDNSTPHFLTFTVLNLLAVFTRPGTVLFILELLALFKKSHKTDSHFQLWEEGSHPQLIQNEAMLRQKLD
jgi:hypothetical protein